MTIFAENLTNTSPMKKYLPTTTIKKWLLLAFLLMAIQARAANLPAKKPINTLHPKATKGTTVMTANDASEYTEDFEDTNVFPTFSVGGITATEHFGAFGDWTLYDGTGLEVYTWNDSSISFDNENAPCAWQVFDPVKAGFSSSQLTPYSGKQYLMSMCVLVNEDHSVNYTDHWLISPKLSGMAQTIKFQARTISNQYGKETFEVLASSTDKMPESFRKVANYTTDVMVWTEFSADLPEGTKYFAIRHTSGDIWGLFIDDVVFCKAAPIAPKSVPRTLVLWHADGTTTDVALSNMPKVEFTGDKVRITSYILDMEYPRTDIIRFTYKDDAIIQVGIDQTPQSPDFTREGDRLVFHGVRSTDKVAVYTTDGKRVPVNLSESTEGVTLSLSSIPRGVYILNVNGKSSKFTRP